MYWSKVLFPLLAVPACQAFPSIHKRASVTGATLYAYGTNISGFPVVYAHENGKDPEESVSNPCTRAGDPLT